MTAPHCHTTEEVKSAIRKIEHKSDKGTPTGIKGGSESNMKTKTSKVTGGDDTVGKRGI